ncbi:hypothetical protein LBMAG56_08340 [Verrucomicrobiota bacterium]|nr:hypothetical protein LBMAG56_08340 [Verrucomicrobiota bacterium]
MQHRRTLAGKSRASAAARASTTTNTNPPPARAILRSLQLAKSLFLVAGLLAFGFRITATAADQSSRAASPLAWTALPRIPDREGFAGSLAGVSGGALLVGGGANFPGKKPWEGGTKVWHDSVFVLEKPEGAWRRAGQLPRPLGYGVSVTYRDGVVCAGGSDERGHRTEVFRMEWRGDALKFSELPALPRPLANACGVVLSDTLYVLGGIETPLATNAMRAFLALDLARPDARWTELAPWPGPGRMLATAGVHAGSLFLFSGTALNAGADGKPVRELLRDAFRFTPGKGWQRLADLPRVAVAAPSPAPVVDGQLLVLGGDDGAQLRTPPTEHRGFPRDILAYDSRTDRWKTLGTVPFSLVTTAITEWRGRIVIPGGEQRPGVRSTEVWSASW